MGKLWKKNNVSKSFRNFAKFTNNIFFIATSSIYDWLPLLLDWTVVDYWCKNDNRVRIKWRDIIGTGVISSRVGQIIFLQRFKLPW